MPDCPSGHEAGACAIASAPGASFRGRFALVDNPVNGRNRPFVGILPHNAKKQQRDGEEQRGTGRKGAHGTLGLAAKQFSWGSTGFELLSKLARGTCGNSGAEASFC